MDATAITSLITSVGFPIVAYLLIFNYMQEQNKAHKEETDSLKDAINNNTLTMQKLIDKLDKEEK